MDFQIFLNSTVLVYVMVRYSHEMFGWKNLGKLTAFGILVWVVNLFFMVGRYGWVIAAMKAFNISTGFLIGALLMGYLKNRKQVR